MTMPPAPKIAKRAAIGMVAVGGGCKRSGAVTTRLVGALCEAYRHRLYSAVLGRFRVLAGDDCLVAGQKTDKLTSFSGDSRA